LLSQPIDRNLVGSITTLAIMVFLMIVLGGLTRLTGSGLSMVDWRPITGILPPLNPEQWLEVFQLYQKMPEYLNVNYGMSLQEFKSIFWLEYIHRLWGRLLGVILLIPTTIIFLKKQFHKLRWSVISLWIAGLAQGYMGWYMVKSGLQNVPWVSPYRLTAHLCLALLIITIILHMLHQIIKPAKINAQQGRQQILVALTLITLTIIMGGFTAGLHAGLIYNTFPFMGDSFIPSDVMHRSPFWQNLFENPATVQFIHRNLALLTVGYIFYISWRGPRIFKALALVALIQVILGISTLLLIVPIWLAALHQAWAILLFAKCWWICMRS
jgi:cytochrome c oxidase assembly protein subunit 15